MQNTSARKKQLLERSLKDMITILDYTERGFGDRIRAEWSVVMTRIISVNRIAEMSRSL